jgi:hypothetical protein
VSLPFDWDFLQDNLSQEKLAELRRRFMEGWRSGEYTRKYNECEKLCEIIKHEIPRRIEKWDTLFRTVLGRSGTAIS